MASMLVSSWYVTTSRGILALGFVLLCLIQASTISTLHADIFGLYVLADGSLCALTVIVAKGGRGSMLLLPAGIVGLTVGLYLISASNVTTMTQTAAIAIWTLAAGLSALSMGYQVLQIVPGSRRLIEMVSGVRVRRGAAAEWGMLLAGVDALVFAAIALALSIAGRAMPVPLSGLFIGVFGYLHLRVGLSLGILALSTETAPQASTTNAQNAATPTVTLGYDASAVHDEGQMSSETLAASSQ